MTTFESNPGFWQFVAWKLAKAANARGEAKEAKATKAMQVTRTQAGIILIIRVMAQLSGLGCLTIAGFTVSITAGLIVAGVSWFVLSYLITGTVRQSQQEARR